MISVQYILSNINSTICQDVIFKSSLQPLHTMQLTRHCFCRICQIIKFEHKHFTQILFF